MADFDTSAYLSVKAYDDLKKGQTLSDGRFQIMEVENDPVSGFYGAIVKDTQTGEGIFVARGTDGLSDIGDDLDLAFGGTGGSQFSAAQDFLETYTLSGGIAVSSVVGHSLGGALAQGIGIVYDLDVVAVGSPGVQGILNNLEAAGHGGQVAGYDYSKITSFVAQNDPLSNFGQQLTGSNVYYLDLDSVVDRTINGQIVSAVIEMSNNAGIADEVVLTVITPGGAVLYIASKELLKINFYHSKENYLKAIEEQFNGSEEKAQIYIIDSETYTVSYTDNYGYLQEVQISPSEQKILQFDLEVNSILANGTVVSQTTTRVTLPDGNEADITVTVKDENGDQVKITQTRVVDANGNIIIGAPATDTYQTLDANGNVISTKEVTTYIDYALRQHQITEYQEGPDGNWIIHDDMYVNGQTIEGPTYVVPSDGLLEAFNLIGGSIGSAIGNELADGNVYKSIVYSAMLGTVIEHFGTFAAYLLEGSDFEAAVRAGMGESITGTVLDTPEVLDTFLNKLQTGVASAISNYIVDEVGDALGLDGVVGDVFDVTASTFTTGLIDETIDLAFNGFDLSSYNGIYENLLFDKFKWSDNLPEGFEAPLPSVKTYGDYVQFQVGKALGGYVGSTLGGEVIEAESKIAGIFGSLGSTIGVWATTSASSALSLTTALTALGNFGAPLVGAAIGAFIGQIAGTALGNLFGGGHDDVIATGHVGFNRSIGEFYVDHVSQDDGGNVAIAESLAAATANGVNAILETTGGALRRSSNPTTVNIGMEDDSYFVIDSKGGMKYFERSGDAIEHAVFTTLKGFDLVGAHVIIQRAWHNSEATTLKEFQHDIQVAEAFQTYLLNPTGVLALMMNEPNSEAAQDWAVILQRAAELELHLPHELDFDGGWGEILAARGVVNPESIPEIQGNDIVLTDPVTGEQTTIQHVIGPGYEIVRIEGDDGNDTIQVVVDGPSISYVTSGPGDDTFTGHDGVDIYVGGEGNDTAFGGDGNDWLLGGLGDDTLLGEAGEDLIVGGADDDELYGGEGDDEIYGGEGNDILHADQGFDRLYGGAGDDILYGNTSVDGKVTMYGGEGNDTLYGYGIDRILNGGEGDDTFYLLQNGKNRVNIDRGDGHDVIESDDNLIQYIRFEKNIGPEELWFQKTGKDLVILVLGEDQSITVKDWFEVDGVRPRFTLQLGGSEGSGNAPYELDYASVSTLVTEYAGFSQQPSGQYNVIHDSVMQEKTVPFLWMYTVGATANYIHGTSGNDTLTGTTGADRIFGSAGDDNIYGNEDTDRLVGGLGNDQIWGGSGHDFLIGSEGNDTLRGEGGHDYLDGGAGNDFLYGGDKNDEMYGGEGNDTLHGDDGTDILRGGEGGDIIYGGADDDIIYGDDGADILTGGEGDDYLSGGEGSDLLTGSSGNDTLDGGEGYDILSYRLADNTDSENVYNGNGGDDTLRIYLTAAEFAQQGMESDLIRFKRTMAENQSQNAASMSWTFALMGLIAHQIENLEVYVDGVMTDISYNEVIGTASDDILTGALMHNLITGDDGNDTITGLSGDDDLQGGLGNDIIVAGDGLNLIDGGEGDDGITGGADKDEILGGTGNDIINAGAGDDDIYGNDGADTINGQDGIDKIYGGFGNDIITGGLGDDELYGQADDDHIEGLEGNDIIDGGSGDDTLIGNEGDDILKGGSGDDTLIGDIDENAAYSGLDKLYGGSGNDTLYGFKGDDELYGEDGVDIIYAGADNDKAYGGKGDDELYGSLGDDELYGESGSDTIDGGDGNDTLEGGFGSDVLTGGTGGDVFVYGASSFDGNPDIITDFNTGESDQILLDYVFYGFSILDSSISDYVSFQIVGSDSDLYVDRDGTDTTYTSQKIATLQNLSGLDAQTLFTNGNIALGNTAPVAKDDFFVATPSGSVSGNLFDDNGYGADSDYDGDTFITPAKSIDAFGYYALTTDADGSFSFHTFNVNPGRYNFSYEITDGISSSYATVSFLVPEAGANIGTSGNDSFTTSNSLGNGNDITYGLAGDDLISDSYGNDILVGGAGDDTLYGGRDDDTYIYELGMDTIYDKYGQDRIIFEDGITAFDIQVVDEGSYDTRIIINAGEDEILIQDKRLEPTGSDRKGDVETIEFSNGLELVFKKTLYHNWVYGTTGDDTMNASSSQSDTLISGDGNDTLYGNAYGDQLVAGSGDDILYGGNSLDYLYGEAGADTFVFESASAFNDVDVVGDFDVSEGDAIDISDLISGYDSLQDAITDFIEITTSGSDSILKVDTNGGGDNFVQIATLTGATGLEDEDALETSGNLIVA